MFSGLGVCWFGLVVMVLVNSVVVFVSLCCIGFILVVGLLEALVWCLDLM